MKAFLIVVATVFTLIVLAHIARITVEPDKAKDPWFLLLTIVAAGLGGWAWQLVWRTRQS
jgi:NO-binding membrane sensor protein with MHYT domain